MNEFIFSIIVPVYKIKKEYLYKCLDSLVNQTVNKDIYEVILIDDNNNEDICGQICDEYAKNNDNFKVIHQENAGVSEARNNGIKIAKAEYILFVDADDWAELNMLEIMMQTQKESPSSDLYIFAANAIYKNKTIKNSFWSESRTFINQDIDKLQLQILCKNISEFRQPIVYVGVPWSKLYRKKIIQKNELYFNKNLKYGEDAVFNLYYTQHCNSIFYQDDIVYNYNINQNNVSSMVSENVTKQFKTLHLDLRFFINKYKQDKSVFRNAFLLRCLFDINNCYCLSFRANLNQNRKEYKLFLKQKLYNEALMESDLSEINFKEKLYIYVLKTKSLMLLHLFAKLHYFVNQKILKKEAN